MTTQNTQNPTSGGDIAYGEAVKLDGGTVVKAAAATDKILGIAQHDAVSGDVVEVRKSGQATVLLKGAVTFGATIGIDASGDLVAVAAPADGDTIVGRCLVADTETDPKLGVIELDIRTAHDAAGA